MTDSTPRSDPERDIGWRSRLTTLQYHVTREAGTEMPNAGIYNMEEKKLQKITKSPQKSIKNN